MTNRHHLLSDISPPSPLVNNMDSSTNTDYLPAFRSVFVECIEFVRTKTGIQFTIRNLLTGLLLACIFCAPELPVINWGFIGSHN